MTSETLRPIQYNMTDPNNDSGNLSNENDSTAPSGFENEKEIPPAVPQDENIVDYAPGSTVESANVEESETASPPSEPQSVNAPSSQEEMKFPSSWKKGIALSLGGTVLLSSVLAGYLGYMSGFSAGKNAGQEITSQLAAAKSNDPDPIIVDDIGSNSVADIAAAVSPSVVKINALNKSGDFEIATGSGVVIDKDGHIVTNAHVAKPDDADEHTIQVVLPDKEIVESTLVGYSQDYDIAVLKIDETNVPYSSWGDSEALKVGEMVVALGSPLGLQGTVTSGIVSAVERPVAAGGSDNNSFLNAIQTDAAINPGNSGGPLINTQAKVIGINTAIATLPTPFASGGEGSIGLGFAIPSNVAKRVAEEIIADGEARTPAIGILIDNTYTGSGVKVLEVSPESPAQKAGIQAGDIIVSLNGKKIEESLELVVGIRSNSVGDTVNIEVSRDEGNQKFNVVLEPLDPELTLSGSEPTPSLPEPEDDEELLDNENLPPSME